MTSPSGEPVAAVYGFARDLLYLLPRRYDDFSALRTIDKNGIDAVLFEMRARGENV